MEQNLAEERSIPIE